MKVKKLLLCAAIALLSGSLTAVPVLATESVPESLPEVSSAPASTSEPEIPLTYTKTVTKFYDSWEVARAEPVTIAYSETDESTGLSYAGTLHFTRADRLETGESEFSITYEGVLLRTDKAQ